MSKLIARVRELGVFHREGLSALTPSGRRGTYYNAGILVLAYTTDGGQILIAKVGGLSNTGVSQKLLVVRQLFSELIGNDISLKLRAGGKIPFEIELQSLPQCLQEICDGDCCYNYKKLELLWRKRQK